MTSFFDTVATALTTGPMSSAATYWHKDGGVQESIRVVETLGDQPDGVTFRTGYIRPVVALALRAADIADPPRNGDRVTVADSIYVVKSASLVDDNTFWELKVDKVTE